MRPGGSRTQFIVTATVPRLLVFAAATAAHAVLFMGLYTLLGLRSFPDPEAAVAIQAVGNALIGVFGVRAVDAIAPGPGAAPGESGDAGEAMTRR